MSIELKTHKMLWGKSGNKCAFPDCRKDLVMDASETDDYSLIGEEAHIVGRKKNSPRGKSELTPEQRNKYSNLILLCSIHHKLVDDQKNKYTVSLLTEYKNKHEDWVNSNLNIDKIKQYEDIIYSGYVDEIIELAGVNNWKEWTSGVFSDGQPHLYDSYLARVQTLIEFIFSRVWSGRYPELERAFDNLKSVSVDFLRVFEEHAQRPKKSNKNTEEDIMVWTRKLYHINEWNSEKYELLSKKYKFHCFLVEDLVLELTRAMNHLFDMVRLYLFRGFRIKEGILLIEIGSIMDLGGHIIRTEYKLEEKQELYPGLKKFMKIREKRNYFIGKGISEDYFPKF